MDTTSLLLIAAAVLGWLIWKRDTIASLCSSAYDSARAGFPELAALLSASEKAAAPMPTPAMVKGAARALRQPPTSLDAARLIIRREKGPDDRFVVPIGWYVSADGAPALDWTALNRTKHILITGKSGSGKEALSRAMLFTLAQDYAPEQVRFAIFDGKGVDWAGWQDVPHTWLMVDEPDDMEAGMLKVTAEIARRRRILRAARVTDWSNYTGTDLPLLVVFVTELTLLQDAVTDKGLTKWLNTNLAAARAFGVRFIVQTQTVSNFATRWRSQIDLFIAGFQPSGSQDVPNANVSPSELAAIGAVPPSQLPAVDQWPGCFTWVRDRRAARTVRTSRVDDAQIAALLARLIPDSEVSESAAPIASRDSEVSESPEAPASRESGSAIPLPGSGSARFRPLPDGQAALEALMAISGEALPRFPEARRPSGDQDGIVGVAEAVEAVEAVDVTADEEARIVAAAREASSRREVAIRVFGSAGGRGFRKVSAVCDRRGLLTPARRPASAAN